MPEVAIFGIGPSGMAAAWAAFQAGYKITFISNTINKSRPIGSQYLHEPIPLPRDRARKVASGMIDRQLNGTPQQYQAKVVGARWGGTILESELAGKVPAWDLRATYDALWDLMTPHRRVKIIAPINIDSNWIATHTSMLSKYAHVISTIPANRLCLNPSFLPASEACHFSQYRTRVSGVQMADVDNDNHEMYHDGTDEALWHRTTLLFGYRTVEWPGHAQGIPAHAQAEAIVNPLRTDCQCHPEIIRLGAQGAWRRGILVSHVYEDTNKLLEGSWVNQAY